MVVVVVVAVVVVDTGNVVVSAKVAELQRQQSSVDVLPFQEFFWIDMVVTSEHILDYGPDSSEERTELLWLWDDNRSRRRGARDNKPEEHTSTIKQHRPLFGMICLFFENLDWVCCLNRTAGNEFVIHCVVRYQLLYIPNIVENCRWNLLSTPVTP